jgi:hypothetical protein
MTRIGYLSLLACMTLAHAGPVKLLPGPFELSDRIGPMRLDGEAHKYDDPRLGTSYQYSGGGLSLTIYVYDLGIPDIPDGGDTRVACEAFEAAKSDIDHAGYSDVRLKSQQLARLDATAETPNAREAVYELTRAERPTISYIWLTGAAKVLLKLRFSVDEKLSDELPEARRAILTALGEAVKPHLSPVDPEAKKQKAQINLSSGDVDDVGSALMYLISLSAAGDEHPELVPVCGGPLVPDFASEVAALKGVLTVAAESGKGSKFTQRLADIDSAGFLEEFTWEFRHQEGWGDQPPEGLELKVFDKWRKKKLKRFQVPVFGNVDYASPRPLPLEPVEPVPAR